MHCPRLVQISESSFAEKNYGKTTITVVLLIIGKTFFITIDFLKPNFCTLERTIERNLEMLDRLIMYCRHYLVYFFII